MHPRSSWRAFVLFAVGAVALSAGWCWADGAPVEKANEPASDVFSGLHRFPNGEPLKSFAPPPNASSSLQVLKLVASVDPPKAKRGEVVLVVINGAPADGWHAYSVSKRTAGVDVAPTISFGKSAALIPLPELLETPPHAVPNAIGGVWEHEKPFKWWFRLLVQTDAPIGNQEFSFTLHNVMACTVKGCLPPVEVPLKVSIEIAEGEPVSLTKEIRDLIGKPFSEAKLVPIDGAVLPPPPVAGKDKGKGGGAAEVKPIVGLNKEYKASMEKLLKQLKGDISAGNEESVWGFILAGMFWGFISLITPCVFPMIPITVSYFLKQSEKEHHKPVTMALVYCGTIVLVLTIAAAALLGFFRVLSISPYMNFGLGLLFIFFALSLFGMYDIELPSFMGRFTSEREGQGGYVGTVFMALTFTIISFACVAPFLGGFGGTAAGHERPWWHLLLGGLAFAATFASPFFILALFPTLLRAMPKSGSWLNSVKVVMGFLELAAALKFFRSGELANSSAGASLFTFDFVLGLWIALCLMCGLYLMGIFRLPHDSPVDHLTVPRMLFSFVFLGLAFYLVPALVGGPTEEGHLRPRGAVYAWVDSFLLPDATGGGKGAGAEEWTGNLEAAVAEARAIRQKTGKAKYIFVDFTGEQCTNCRINERSVFSKAEFQQLFKQYLLVQLYTDKVPLHFYSATDRSEIQGASRQLLDAKVNNWFETTAFGTATLPTYVILEPKLDGTIEIIGINKEGRIFDEAAFADFMRKPFAK